MTLSRSQRMNSMLLLGIALVVTVAFMNDGTRTAITKLIAATDSPVIRSTSDNRHRRLKKKRKDEHDAVTKTASSSNKAAIVILTTNLEQDIRNLCNALHSLVALPGDKHLPRKQKAPVLVFNEGNLSKTQMSHLESCASNGNRNIAFPIIRLNNHYPKDFGDVWTEYETYKRSVGIPPTMKFEGRAPAFSYMNMIRFWTYLMWEHPAVQQFDTVMRMDTDSCFIEAALKKDPDLQHLPFLPKQYVYHSLGPGSGVGRHFFDTDTGRFRGASIRAPIKNVEQNYDCQKRAVSMRIVGLQVYTQDYVQQHGITPRNTGMWDTVIDAYEQICIMNTFATHFEVMRRDFFRSPEVRQWHKSLSEREPFGVLRKRWGDAQTRFLTLAMFAPEGSVLVTSEKGGGYAHGRDYDTPNKEFRCRRLLAAEAR